jgi:DNA-binding response OmpR family regulator
MSPRNTVLIVEDDLSVQTLVRGYLELQDHAVVAVGTASEAYEEIRNRKYDVVLLDMGLPDEEGLAVARRINAVTDTPIIFVTGRDDEESRIVGLEVGAADYVSKPFHPRELSLRIRNVLKRKSAKDPVNREQLQFTFGPWKVDLSRRTVVNENGAIADLTRAELEVLIALLRAKSRVLTRDQLLDAIQSEAGKASDRVIDVLVSRIRKKLELKSKGSPAIITVTGVGYKLSEDGWG